MKPNNCELCNSNIDYLNFHHLIPRSQHKNKKVKKLFSSDEMKKRGIWICKQHCHRNIHRFISEKNMALIFNTKELLLSNELVLKYVNWRSKKFKNE